MFRVLIAGEPFTAGFAEADVPSGLRRAFTWEGGRVTAHGPGLFSIGDTSAVVLPRLYSADSDEREQLDGAGHTLRVLRRYLDDSDQQRSVVASDLRFAPATSGDVAALFDRLETALLLWDDYRALGPLAIATRHTSTDPRGRIHWPRTIAATVPLVSHLDVLYPDAVRTRHALDAEHPLSRLHAQTVESVAWFLGTRRRRNAPPLPGAREALGLLDRHERTLFQDRQRYVGGLLRRYYRPSHRETRGAAHEATGVFATSFPHVWERMLFVALGSQELPSLPEGRYTLADGNRGPQGTRFVLDLLLEADWGGERVQVVVDAKDYQQGTLPRGDSVNKQILYRLLLSSHAGVAGDGQSRLPLWRIGNAFLGPALFTAPSGLRLCAVHDFVGIGQGRNRLGRIVSLEADFRRVAVAYAQGRTDRAVRDAIVKLVMESMSAAPAAAAVAGASSGSASEHLSQAAGRDA